MEPLEDVWTSRDYAVLRDVVRRIDTGQQFPSNDDVASTTALPAADVRLAALALRRRGLLACNEDYDGGIVFEDVAGAAYLITGLHPDSDDALTRLVETLMQAAEQTSDEDERGRLRRAADALRAVSRNVMTGVLTAYLTGQLPT